MMPKDKVASIIIKTISYLLLGGVVLFVLLYVSVHIYFYHAALPKITSDKMLDDSDISARSMLLSDIQREIRRVLGGDNISLKNLKSLYFASEGPLFPSYYIAFQMDSKEECESLLNSNDYFTLKNFQKGDFLTEGPWRYYQLPHTWDKKYQDSNWPLKEGGKFLYHGDYQKLILYVPEENRFYICIDGGP